MPVESFVWRGDEEETVKLIFEVDGWVQTIILTHMEAKSLSNDILEKIDVTPEVEK